MPDEQERQAARAERERAAALREREVARRRIADLERERARIDADLSEARAQFRTGTFDADTPFEVLVDTLGALGEHVKGDIVRPGEGPYDFAWLERSGSVRRLSPDEVRLMEQRPMESTTQPLTAEGAVDLTATVVATAPVDATGLPVPADVAAVDREASQEQRAEQAGDAIEAREREGRARRGR
jgi:hypothetical protein